MDLSGMPIPEQNGVSNVGQTPDQQPAQETRTNMFEQDVYMGVSSLGCL
jgi:hypothetical protein